MFGAKVRAFAGGFRGTSEAYRQAIDRTAKGWDAVGTLFGELDSRRPERRESATVANSIRDDPEAKNRASEVPDDDRPPGSGRTPLPCRSV